MKGGGNGAEYGHRVCSAVVHAGRAGTRQLCVEQLLRAVTSSAVSQLTPPGDTVLLFPVERLWDVAVFWLFVAAKGYPL